MYKLTLLSLRPVQSPFPIARPRTRLQHVCVANAANKGRLPNKPNQKLQTKASGFITRDGGTIWLCFINVAVYLMDHVAGIGWIQNLYLFHSNARWWQFITAAFCHYNWAHLSNNLFLLYVFGKLVEEREGALGVVTSYLVCAIGGNLAAYMFYPASSVSLGASAAVFGLFTVSFLIRISWRFKALIEAGILGQFVVGHILNEISLHMEKGQLVAGANVSHVAHLGGALMGVALLVLLHALPDPQLP